MRVPERLFEAMLMAVTRPLLSPVVPQLMPSHLQKLVPVQLEGVGLRPFPRFSMTAASSAMAEARRENNRQNETREAMLGGRRSIGERQRERRA